MNKRDSKGQVLLVTVLIIALLLLSTELYVYDLGRTLENGKPDSLSDFIAAVTTGAEHIVIGSLANVSQGGTSQTLQDNLHRWSSFIGSRYQFGKCILNFTLRETTPYTSGVWISWETEGVGVSRAYAEFTLKLSDQNSHVNLTHTTNATTTLRIRGVYKKMMNDTKQVNVTCNLLNEGSAALASSITLYYRNLSEWLIPSLQQNNYTIMDYGNGTYFMSFLTRISSSEIEVSVHASDRRNIRVQANTTCPEI